MLWISSKYCTSATNDKRKCERIKVWEKKIKKHAQTFVPPKI